MDSENKFWLAVWGILGTTVCIITITLAIYNYKVEAKMASLGFQKTTVIGSNQALYQKATK